MTSAGLEDIFMHDPSFIVRMQALLLSPSFADGHTKAIIMSGFSDPYENIRRQACHMAGKMGCNDFIEPLKSLQAGANETQRVQYAAQTALEVFDPAQVGGDAELANSTLDEAGIRYLRNNPQHFRIPELLGFLADAAQPADLRVVMAEALGWFNNSAQRMQIAAALEEQLGQKELPEALRAEMVKTVRRLKNN